MKINEKDWIMDGHKIGTILFYSDVEPELEATVPGTRVLPSCYYYEKKMRCELLNRYEPGQHKHFPNGGFEVWVENGGRRFFDLNQVIIHPDVIKHTKRLEKMKLKAEKEQNKRLKSYEKAQRKVLEGVKKRGRKALSPEEKAQREADKKARAERSGGKRGRPKGANPSTPKVYVPTGGKRGRKPLSEEVKAAREAEKKARTQRSGGKRGRPKRK